MHAHERERERERERGRVDSCNTRVLRANNSIKPFKSKEQNKPNNKANNWCVSQIVFRNPALLNIDTGGVRLPNSPQLPRCDWFLAKLSTKT